MKRFITVILTLIFVLINTSVFAANSVVQKEISTISTDKFNIKASLTYKKVKGQTDYKTVVLIHSLGTNSGWWENLPDMLLDEGYAVIKIDLRGHGKSIFNSKLSKVSWKSLTNMSFARYPDDVISVILKIKEDYPKMNFFGDWAMVGSDIGASAGIIAADTIKEKPKTIIILNPVVKTHSLYIPVHVAQLDGVDFLTISSESDMTSLSAEKYLKKFAQNGFESYTSPSNVSGMIILKNDPELKKIITEWIKQYLK